MKPKYILLTKDTRGYYGTAAAVYRNDNATGGHNVTTLFDSVDAAKECATKLTYRNYTIAAFVTDVEQVPRFDTKVTEYSH